MYIAHQTIDHSNRVEINDVSSYKSNTYKSSNDLNYGNYQRKELKFSKNKVWFNMSPPGGHTWCGELHFVVYHSNRATIKYGFSLKRILIMA